MKLYNKPEVEVQMFTSLEAITDTVNPGDSYKDVISGDPAPFAV